MFNNTYEWIIRGAGRAYIHSYMQCLVVLNSLKKSVDNSNEA